MQDYVTENVFKIVTNEEILEYSDYLYKVIDQINVKKTNITAFGNVAHIIVKLQDENKKKELETKLMEKYELYKKL